MHEEMVPQLPALLSHTRLTPSRLLPLIASFGLDCYPVSE